MSGRNLNLQASHSPNQTAPLPLGPMSLLAGGLGPIQT